MWMCVYMCIYVSHTRMCVYDTYIYTYKHTSIYIHIYVTPIIMLFSKIDSAEATHVSVQCYTLESITEPYERGTHLNFN